MQQTARPSRSGSCQTCPATGERLCSADLVTNVAARARGHLEAPLLLSRGVSLHERSSKRRPLVCGRQKRHAVRHGVVRLPARVVPSYFLMARLSCCAPRTRRRTKPASSQSGSADCRTSSTGRALWTTWMVCRGCSTPPHARFHGCVCAGQCSERGGQPAGDGGSRRADRLGLIIDAVNVSAKVEARSNPDSPSTITRSAASHGRARRPARLVRRRQRPRSPRLTEQPAGK